MSSWLFLLTAFVFTYGPVANALPANASLPGNASHAANPSKAMDVCAQDPFFKVTRENLEESKALEWFADWGKLNPLISPLHFCFCSAPKGIGTGDSPNAGSRG